MEICICFRCCDNFSIEAFQNKIISFPSEWVGKNICWAASLSLNKASLSQHYRRVIECSPKLSIL